MPEAAAAGCRTRCPRDSQGSYGRSGARGCCNTMCRRWCFIQKVPRVLQGLGPGSELSPCQHGSTSGAACVSARAESKHAGTRRQAATRLAATFSLQEPSPSAPPSPGKCLWGTAPTVTPGHPGTTVTPSCPLLPNVPAALRGAELAPRGHATAVRASRACRCPVLGRPSSQREGSAGVDTHHDPGTCWPARQLQPPRRAVRLELKCLHRALPRARPGTAGMGSGLPQNRAARAAAGAGARVPRPAGSEHAVLGSSQGQNRLSWLGTAVTH